MALTGNADTDTSGTPRTLGSQALGYSQGGATEDEVREQEASAAAEVEQVEGATAPAVDETGGPRRRPVTTPQIIGGILIVAIVVAAALWYVPRIVRSDARSFTGTVSSSGVANLNFAGSGLVGKVPVQLGQSVRAGQVLATETSPSTCIGFSLLANLASLVRSTRQDVRVKKHARTGMDKLPSLM